MKRILFAILLDVVATIGLILFLVLPSMSSIDSVPGLSKTLQNLLCEDREILNVESHSYRDSDGSTNYSANFYCTYETKTRDVTGPAMLFGILIFAVPLVLSIFLFISGGVALSKNRRTTDEGYNITDGGFGFESSGSGTERVSTTDRLRTLKRAYDEGLISETEYEAKRQEILREI